LIKDISRPALSTYERVRRGRGGRAVVTVKKRACGSCFKALTPKKIQEIKRADRVLTCDYCGCLLYWDNEESD
jgi:predicted  nucleic acid-binding Zn-ribbon protein